VTEGKSNSAQNKSRATSEERSPFTRDEGKVIVLNQKIQQTINVYGSIQPSDVPPEPVKPTIGRNLSVSSINGPLIVPVTENLPNKLV